MFTQRVDISFRPGKTPHNEVDISGDKRKGWASRMKNGRFWIIFEKSINFKRAGKSNSSLSRR